ncbi:hypothetical protein B0J13DRAFT_548176 [Dactylonectria estremocensis]|uniref:Nephrocystin 3-like N-terminal domain-containing protein n=1 Tax=Dactylonectria estremocensis TaxID=1079267 RepID=A0A9P9F396_9HYPO|nr:hypothetical protein B0J13DRAFT_548176 [Dactylonectria estremocensis]
MESGLLQLTESTALVLKLLERYRDATMMIAIDALDECNNRQDILSILEDLLESSPCLVKIFDSSREDQGIVYKLGNYPNLHLSSSLNAGDIEQFVRWKTYRLINDGFLLRFSTRERERGQALHDQTTQRLTSDAQGMFRWVALQLEALQELRTEQAVTESLGRLPKDLKELYQDILSKIEDSPGWKFSAP